MGEYVCCEELDVLVFELLLEVDESAVESEEADTSLGLRAKAEIENLLCLSVGAKCIYQIIESN